MQQISQSVAHAKYMRGLNVNLVNWQPIVGTVEFPTGAIAAGTQRTMFLDRLTESASSGRTGGQTEADGTFFGGKVGTGQLILLESFGLSFGDITAANVNLYGQCSVQMNLRGRPIDMGTIQDWPSINGVSGIVANGRQIVSEYRFDTPHLLEPLDDFTVRFRFEAAVTMAALSLVRGYFGATRVYDERVLAVS
jgi:hypothetical protein